MKLPGSLLNWLIVISLSWTSGAISRAQSAEPQCRWDYARFASRKMLRSMDPADRQAIESVLIQIFRNPDQEPSAAAKVWIRDFELQEAVEILRREGKEIQNKVRRQELGRKAALAVGSSLVAGIIGSRTYTALRRSLTPEQALNEEFGLSLQGNQPEELSLLEGILRCNPKRSDPLPLKFRKALSQKHSVREVTQALLFEIWGAPEVLAELGTSDKANEGSRYLEAADKAYDDALHLWLSRKFAFCTRWGTDSQNFFRPGEISEYRVFLEKIPFGQLGLGTEAISGIVRVSSLFQPSHAIHSGRPVAAHYVTDIRKIELFTPYAPGYTAQVLVHEMGHHIDKLRGNPSLRPEFQRLCTNPPNDWYPLGDTSIGEPYAKSGGLTECFAEGVSCFTADPDCRKKMSVQHPEMHRYFKELLRLQE